ncbi:MAG TPA: hypothetical protein ENI65_08015 [Gammaproteobacteria bacterium]|nr:hypothetical protein [Gammaproteobacteria bacterium]
MEGTRGKKINSLVRLAWLLASTLALSGQAQAVGQSLRLTGVQNGDLILRRGKGMMSDIAASFSISDRRFSHVGIAVMKNRKAYVVHSIQDDDKGYNGVVREPLSDFLGDVSDWAVYRLKLDRQQQNKLARTASRYAHQHIAFDTRFDLDSSNVMYCTELVWRASAEVSQPNLIQPTAQKSGGRFITIEDTYRHNNAVLIESMH